MGGSLSAYSAPVAPLLIDGTMNGETFRAYIEQFMVPILKRNDPQTKRHCRD
jgi:hypothetical protein